MKGGRTPLHIMRFAPADYVEDPWVKLALQRNDTDLVAFYHLFLCHSFIHGGKLDASSERLRATLGVRWQVVKRGMEYWSHPDCGLIKVMDGKAWNPRVLRDVEKALAFVDVQAQHGKDGGRGNRKGFQKASLSETENQPLPMPEPKPMPVASAVQTADQSRRNPLVDRDRLLREGYAAIAEIHRLSGDDQTAILARNSVPKNKPTSYRPAVRLDDLFDDRLARTVHDLKSELAQLKLPSERDGFHMGLRTESPQQAAERRAREERERGSN